jgi:hypothetical protein
VISRVKTMPGSLPFFSMIPVSFGRHNLSTKSPFLIACVLIPCAVHRFTYEQHVQSLNFILMCFLDLARPGSSVYLSEARSDSII